MCLVKFGELGRKTEVGSPKLEVGRVLLDDRCWMTDDP
jgi:hypothetical protein